MVDICWPWEGQRKPGLYVYTGPSRFELAPRDAGMRMRYERWASTSAAVIASV